MAEDPAFRQDRREQEHRRRQHDQLRGDAGDVFFGEKPSIGTRKTEGGVVKRNAHCDADGEQRRKFRSAGR